MNFDWKQHRKQSLILNTEFKHQKMSINLDCNCIQITKTIIRSNNVNMLINDKLCFHSYCQNH